MNSFKIRLKQVFSLLLIGLITLYKVTLSPLIGASCRFYPTCSTYAQEAIRLHGPLGGSWLALKRVISCHPWGSSGYDPVPGPSQNQETRKRAQRKVE